MEKLVFDISPGPLGELLLVASERGLRAAIWNEARHVKLPRSPEGRLELERRPSHPILEAARKQLDEYFSRKRRVFDLPLDPIGSPFQQRAWKALTKIPYGKTVSYQEQAMSLGGSHYARAVGSANRVNPIAIIVPCHRVIGKNGNLTGFLYGTDAKQLLLSLELIQS